MSEMVANRLGFGKALADYGSRQDIVVLDADLAGCTYSGLFGEKYPDRYFNVGIQEANMVGLSAGLAASGKTAVCCSFAMFSSGRAYEQVRNSVAYPHLNVKVVGSHSGLSAGEDGGTHQCLEDLALMTAIPGMMVLNPCDAHEAVECTRAMLDYQGPVYLRLARIPVETITDTWSGYNFELGKACMMQNGHDVTLISTGILLHETLEATRILEEEGISARVLNMPTVKPLDEEAVLLTAKETGAIVTVEDHNYFGGLGASVAEFLAVKCPIPIEIVAVKDKFGHSGNAKQLMIEYGLCAENIVNRVHRVLKRKKIH